VGDLTPAGCIGNSGNGPASCIGTAGLSGAAGVAVSQDGKSVYVASVDSDALVVFRRAANGDLTPAGCIGNTGNGPPSCIGTAGLDGADSVAVSPDNNSVYVASFTSRAVVVFRRAASTGGGGGGGTSGPTLSALNISPHSFAAAKSGGSVAHAAGGKVSFTLSVAARVRFTVQQTVSGRRRSDGKCVAPSPENRHNKHCLRVLDLGSFTVNGVAGADSFHFTGRVNGHKLAPNGYTLVAVASANGKTSKKASVHFSIHR
jgi:DNA-binding beta-propeller fold protein YncE